MKIGCLFFIFPFVLLWSVVAIILNLCGVGAFASWDITAMPWRWSCLCVLYWYIILTVGFYIGVVLASLFIVWRREKVISQYPPEQRDFIRRAMNRND